MARSTSTTRSKPTRKPAARKPSRKRPETLRLRTLTPSLTVNDLQQSLAWYRDVLGFHVTEKWMNEGQSLGAMLRAGDVHIVLGQDDFELGRDRRKGEGFRIYCRTGQDLDSLAEEMKARGARLAHEPRDQPWGAREFAVIDPDGFKLTFSN